jgi:hypothetical protein
MTDNYFKTASLSGAFDSASLSPREKELFALDNSDQFAMAMADISEAKAAPQEKVVNHIGGYHRHA